MSVSLLDLVTLRELERRVGRERVIRVVAAQIATGRDLSRRLSALELAPDPALIKALAHQLAGSSGSIGLHRLSEEAARLEYASPLVEPSSLAPLVRNLRQCLESSESALHAEFPELART
jgi:HPt (histidine-containing phosphotransfer) domain-containing protein